MRIDKSIAVLLIVCLALAAACPALAAKNPGAGPRGAGVGEGAARDRMSVAFYYNRAQYAIKRKIYSEALEAINEGVKIDPSYLPFLWQKAVVLNRLRQYDEAGRTIELAISAMPDNVELSALAVENITAMHALDPDRLHALLTDHFKRADPRIVPALVYGLTESYPLRGRDFQQVLRAVQQAGILNDIDQRILAACLDGKPQEAAALLKSALEGLKARQDLLLAALCLLTAEGLQSKKKTAEAEEMYARAVSLGCKREKAVAAKARVFMSTGDPGRSAEAWAAYWRSSSAPSLWAIKAAEGFAASGRKDEALDILRQALKIAPNDPYLLGEYYFYMDLAGKTAELAALAAQMESSRQLAALNYGKFLAARRVNDLPLVNQAREAVLKNVENITFVHEQESVRLILESLGLSGQISPLERQANLLRATGWELWSQGRYSQAFICWKDAIALDSGRNRISGANMGVLLVQQGMVPQALEIFAKQFPDLSPMSLGLLMMRNEQWYAAQPLLSSIQVAGDLRVWHALGLAYSSLKNGSREEAEAAAARLLALDPPAGIRTVMIPDQNAGLAAMVLDRRYYQALLKDLFSELFRQGYSGLFTAILASGQLKALPPAEAAAMLSDAAFELAARGGAQEAAPLWRAAIALAPGLPDAALGMALVEKTLGERRAADDYLKIGLGGDSLKKEYILGRLAMLDGRQEEAAAHFAAYMRRAPQNLAACFELFHLYMAMPDYRRARDVRARFAEYGNLPEARMYLAQCDLELGRHKAAEKMFRAVLRQNPGHVPAVLGLVAALRAQDRLEEAAAALAAHNLEDPETLAVLRKKAEAAMERRDTGQARAYAREYLEREPDSAYMNDICNISLREEYRLESARLERLGRDRLMLDKGRLDPAALDPARLKELQSLDPAGLDALKADEKPLLEAEEHAKGLLQRNPIQRNAMESILDIALQRGDFGKAAWFSTDMAAAYPQDPYYLLQSAVHMGSISRFRHAFPIAEKMAAAGANASAAAAHFANISALARSDAYTPGDIENTLEVLQRRYRIASCAETLTWAGARADKNTAQKIPLLLIVGRAAPPELAAIDAALERRKARAALLVSEESFSPGTPENFPDAAFLRRLATSGRWEFILTDSMPRAIVKDASGRKGNFWAGRGLVDGRPETGEEMKKRWSRALAAIKAKARAQGFELNAWMFPGGDYGQLGLDGGPEIRDAYGQAVREHFAMSFAPTGTGYRLDCADPMFIPVRNLHFPLDDKALAAMPESHPSRLAVLEEALLAGWHGQLPRAERLFGRAAALGLSAKDIAYYRANNALYDGDAPYANELARAARALDPESLRVEILAERAERLLRPRVSFTPRWWNDDADRAYAEYALTVYGHAREDLALYALAADITWGNRGSYVNGQAAGAGLRYYPFKQHWLDVMARGVRLNDGSDGFAEWRAVWRGVYAADFLNVNGSYNLTYSRESLETRESVQKGAYADRLAANTEMRLLNWGVLEADLYSISRTDGNNTLGGSLSPRYIVWDKPHLRLGYLFSAADSGRNPAEYYAPREYVNHMAVFSGEYELFSNFHVRGMLGYGAAKSKDKDWQEALRCSAGFNWSFKDNFSLQGGYQRLELPDYALDQYTLGIQYVF